jgi:hypothetical protein
MARRIPLFRLPNEPAGLRKLSVGLSSEISNLSEARVRDPFVNRSVWVEAKLLRAYMDLSLRSRFQEKAKC